ncbi:hypothetical protein GCM10025883_28340 [Mobilicoccus caccae]|uniref:Transposase n=1 Tax=Mobilicoccus caccae TaxID=1859295 RepID=A0ABQ6ITI3_9MICO|nr:hypothetical protein GCM10025883_28340 [Mobilicoccus caccae]
MPKDTTPGKPTTRRYSPEEKAAAVPIGRCEQNPYIATTPVRETSTQAAAGVWRRRADGVAS